MRQSAIVRVLQDAEQTTARQVARARMSPGLSYGRHFGPPAPTSRKAAVLIMLEPPRDLLGTMDSGVAIAFGKELDDSRNPDSRSTVATSESPINDWQGWTIPLTVRPDYLPDHPGQISLPGGRLENTESFAEAATREFNEEMGLAEFPGKLLGELSPLYVYNSDYYVKPFLAIADRPQRYQPCKFEVARIIHLPIPLLIEQNVFPNQPFQRGAVRWNAPTIHFEEDHVWGATAIMLAELAWLLIAMNSPANDPNMV